MAGRCGIYPRPIRPVIIPVGPSIAYVQLTRGYYSLIDSEDAGVVGLYNWRANVAAGTYARRCYGRHGFQCLHTFLAGAGMDHINGNGLDNRRTCNLRFATQSQNNQNRRRHRNNKSGYKGVSWRKARRNWIAVIQIDGKRKHLGGFSTPEAAHEAYCNAAVQFHGEFARTT